VRNGKENGKEQGREEGKGDIEREKNKQGKINVNSER
jgi:hypothetical protein